MRLEWRAIASGRIARLLTIVLLIIQLTGCVFDLTHSQVALMSGFCMVTDNRMLGMAGAAIGLALTLSWLVGLASLRIANLRPVYWLLFLAIPLAFVVQMQLLHRHVLSCDAP